MAVIQQWGPLYWSLMSKMGVFHVAIMNAYSSQYASTVHNMRQIGLLIIIQIPWFLNQDNPS